MATITPRVYKGKISYRVMLRRKGYKMLCITFPSEEEAVNWVMENEEKYFEDPKKYQDLMFLKRIIACKRNGWFPYEI